MSYLWRFCVLGAVALLVCPHTHANTEIDALKEKLLEVPNDVDVRLKLALRLAWAGDRTRARQQAKRVVRRAPQYWDAHLLLARLDAWQGQYLSAKKRLATVMAAQPDLKDGLLLAADVGLWSGDYGYARAAIAQLEQIEPTADLYTRLAVIEHKQLRYVKAYRLAGRALKLDPEHKQARQLRADTKFVTADLSTEFEVFPTDDPNLALAVGETLTVTVLPRSRVSYTAMYEYRWRFRTHNHRLALRADWRVTPKLTLTGLVRSGFVHVVPSFTAYAAADYQFSPRYSAGVQYIFDKMTWPGQLHRVRVNGGVQLEKNMRLNGAYYAGLLRHCGTNDLLQGVLLRNTWIRKPFEAYVQYAFGMELERPPLPAYLRGRFDDDVCLGDEFPGAPSLALVDTRAHEVGGQLLWHINKKTILRGGYGIQLRFGGDEVHLGHIAVRRWF